MKFFRWGKKKDFLRDRYLRDVFADAEIDSRDLDLYLIGQFNYESEEQVQSILADMASERYEPIHGFHDSQMTNDLLLVYLVVTGDTCKLLLVFDPVELFHNASLVKGVAIRDCARAAEFVVRKDL